MLEKNYVRGSEITSMETHFLHGGSKTTPLEVKIASMKANIEVKNYFHGRKNERKFTSMKAEYLTFVEIHFLHDRT